MMRVSGGNSRSNAFTIDGTGSQAEAGAVLQGMLTILQRHGREGQAELLKMAQALEELRVASARVRM